MKTLALIGYDNVFTEGTLSASSDPEGGEKENAVDGFTFDHWEPVVSGSPTESYLQVLLTAAAAVDYLAIHAHDGIGSISLRGSNDGTTWTTISGPHTPEDGPNLWRFASVSYTRYRVYVTGNVPQLGVLQAGAIMVLPEGVYVGHKPSKYNRADRIMNNKSEGGQLIGRTLLAEGAQGMTISQDRVTPAWARDTWEAFAQHAKTKPFFFAWRHAVYPLEVMYAWSTGPASISVASQTFMSVSLEIEGQ